MNFMRTSGLGKRIITAPDVRDEAGKGYGVTSVLRETIDEGVGEGR